MRDIEGWRGDAAWGGASPSATGDGGTRVQSGSCRASPALPRMGWMRDIEGWRGDAVGGGASPSATGNGGDRNLLIVT